MRKKIFFIGALAASLFVTTPVMAFKWSDMNNTSKQSTNEEILFRDVPWGTNYIDVTQLLPEFDWYDMSFDGMRNYSVNEIVTGGVDYFDFNNYNLTLVAQPFSNKEIDVAGYTTSDMELYFAYTPTNGEIIRENSNTALYGATYEIEPENLESASTDIINKLTSLYGEPVDEQKETDYLGLFETRTYWKGANDTEVVVRSVDASADTSNLFNDELWIAYVWEKGDDILKEADSIISKTNGDSEASVYGNGSTNGL